MSCSLACVIAQLFMCLCSYSTGVCCRTNVDMLYVCIFLRPMLLYPYWHVLYMCSSGLYYRLPTDTCYPPFLTPLLPYAFCHMLPYWCSSTYGPNRSYNVFLRVVFPYVLWLLTREPCRICYCTHVAKRYICYLGGNPLFTYTLCYAFFL
jgi:hypothetical protein